MEVSLSLWETVFGTIGRTLVKEYGQGFSLRNLRDMQRFYEYFTIQQALSAEFGNVGKRQALPDEWSSTKTPDKPSQKRQAVPAESKGPFPIDFRSHSHLGWTYYRILLGIKDNIKRYFYSPKP